MKILYIHQHFASSQGIGGTRTHDVSRYLVKRGNKVTVICGYSKTKGVPSVKKFRLWRSYWLDGIKVIVCNVNYDQKKHLLVRGFAFFLFSIIAVIAGLKEKGIDLVFATSTPLTVTIPGIIISKIKAKPYVFEARDLWPEDSVAAGWLKDGSLAHKFLSFLEKVTYKNADQITVVSKGFYNRLIERKIPEDKLNFIPLGADAEKFIGIKKDATLFKRNNIDNKIIAIYSGAHGKANGLDQLVEASNFLKDYKEIAIVLIGAGKEKENLVKMAKKYSLTNIHFLDPVPIGELIKILKAADIGLVIFKQIKRPRWLTPNKFYDYCFAGLPSVINFPGTTAELVEENNVGMTATSGNPEDMANAILKLAQNKTLRLSLGKTAESYAFNNFDRKQIAEELEELFIKSINIYKKNT